MNLRRKLPKHLMPEIAPEDDGSAEFDGRCKTCDHSESEGDTYWCSYFLHSVNKADAHEGCRGYVQAEEKDDDDEDEVI